MISLIVIIICSFYMISQSFIICNSTNYSILSLYEIDTFLSIKYEIVNKITMDLNPLILRD